MDKRRRRKHDSHQRGLGLVDEHRTFLTGSPAGVATVAKLDQAMADESTAFADQDNSDSRERSAADRVAKLRHALQNGLRHIATVSSVVTPAGGDAAPFDPTQPRTDKQLIARAENFHAAAVADVDAFTKGGVQTGMLDAFAGDLEAFKKAKTTLAQASQQHQEAADRFDRAYEQADKAFLVVEGILATSPDAPVGALAALRATKRIGPRVEDNTTPTTPAAPAPPANPATPVTTTNTITPATPPVPDKAA